MTHCCVRTLLSRLGRGCVSTGARACSWPAQPERPVTTAVWSAHGRPLHRDSVASACRTLHRASSHLPRLLSCLMPLFLLSSCWSVTPAVAIVHCMCSVSSMSLSTLSTAPLWYSRVPFQRPCLNGLTASIARGRGHASLSLPSPLEAFQCTQPRQLTHLRTAAEAAAYAAHRRVIYCFMQVYCAMDAAIGQTAMLHFGQVHSIPGKCRIIGNLVWYGRKGSRM